MTVSPTARQNPADQATLIAAAAEVEGVDPEAARKFLASGAGQQHTLQQVSPAACISPPCTHPTPTHAAVSSSPPVLQLIQLTACRAARRTH